MGSKTDNFKSISTHSDSPYSKEIELKITQIDSRLGFVIEEMKAVQDEMFRLYSYIKGTDIRELTDTRPWEKTPADLFWTLQNKEGSEDNHYCHKCIGCS